MIMSFSMAPAAPASNSTAAQVSAPVNPGAPAAVVDTPEALPPLFAKAMAGVPTVAAPAPATVAAPAPADNVLPAMAAPIMQQLAHDGMPRVARAPSQGTAPATTAAPDGMSVPQVAGLEKPLSPATVASAATHQAAQQQVPARYLASPLQADTMQSNPGLLISQHPAAITLNLRAAPEPADDQPREPLAAVDPTLSASMAVPAEPALAVAPMPAPVVNANQAPLADATLAASQAAAAQPAVAAALPPARTAVSGNPPPVAITAAMPGRQAPGRPVPANRTTPEILTEAAAPTAAAVTALAPARGEAATATFRTMLATAGPTPALPGDGERGTSAAAPATASAPLAAWTTAAASGAAPAPGSDTIKLNGPAQQWQEPLREALGERLQTQISRNSEHTVIRLDPPMLGRIDISIRHTAGTLQVNLSASNTEVLRQLQGIGETMRTDLAQRQYTEVAVNISATPRSPAAQAFADGDARGQRQPGRQQDEAEPGRALSDGTPGGKPYGATFAMHEQEYN